jgi:hypothetical protein
LVVVAVFGEVVVLGAARPTVEEVVVSKAPIVVTGAVGEGVSGGCVVVASAKGCNDEEGGGLVVGISLVLDVGFMVVVDPMVVEGSIVVVKAVLVTVGAGTVESGGVAVSGGSRATEVEVDSEDGVEVEVDELEVDELEVEVVVGEAGLLVVVVAAVVVVVVVVTKGSTAVGPVGRISCPSGSPISEVAATKVYPSAVMPSTICSR